MLKPVTDQPPLLTAEDLRVHFPVRTGLLMKQTGAVKAVDGVSLQLGAGETLGLVGESGCGKSTLGKALVRLLTPTSGKILFSGREITHLSQGQLRPLRRDFQMIFQDPAESLDARMSVRSLVEEPFVIHGMGTRAERKKWVDELLETVGLSASSAEKYSFEFSGGQRQRIGSTSPSSPRSSISSSISRKTSAFPTFSSPTTSPW
jgi:peptide/nickel transport system ATP-binding protein